MKKIIISSIALMLLSGSLALIQISCQQTAASPTLQTNTGTPVNLGVVLVASNDSTLFVMKYDGSDVKQIPIVMPAKKVMQGFTSRLSPDGTKVFFMGHDKDNGDIKTLYSANIDGSNLLSIWSGSGYLIQPY